MENEFNLEVNDWRVVTEHEYREINDYHPDEDCGFRDPELMVVSSCGIAWNIAMIPDGIPDGPEKIAALVARSPRMLHILQGLVSLDSLDDFGANDLLLCLKADARLLIKEISVHE